MIEIMIATMLAALSTEIPKVETDERFAPHRKSVAMLAAINAEQAETVEEAAVLVAVQWFEARYRVKPRDGDPRFNRELKRNVGTAVGPMQISKGATFWLPRIDPQWRGVTVEVLRDPETNVRAGLSVLRHWRATCVGKPGAWISAYGWGKCTPRGYVDREGVRRCAVAAAVRRRLGASKPWVCGHEKKKLDPQTIRLVRAIDAG